MQNCQVITGRTRHDFEGLVYIRDFRGGSFNLTSGELATRPAIGSIAPRRGVPLALGHLQAKVAHL